MLKGVVLCLILGLLYYNLLTFVVSNVQLCGENVEIADNQKHLGNRHYKRGFDSDFYKRSNAVVSSFNVCDSKTMKHSHSLFCSNICQIFYGGKLIGHVFRAPYRTQ